jgi:hypothetical protein
MRAQGTPMLAELPLPDEFTDIADHGRQFFKYWH